MLALALFSWWYTTAWKALGRKIGQRVDTAMDFFSVSLLRRRTGLSGAFSGKSRGIFCQVVERGIRDIV